MKSILHEQNATVQKDAKLKHKEYYTSLCFLLLLKERFKLVGIIIGGLWHSRVFIHSEDQTFSLVEIGVNTHKQYVWTFLYPIFY